MQLEYVLLAVSLNESSSGWYKFAPISFLEVEKICEQFLLSEQKLELDSLLGT